jgi:hypothetical protein
MRRTCGISRFLFRQEGCITVITEAKTIRDWLWRICRITIRVIVIAVLAPLSFIVSPLCQFLPLLSFP